MSIELFVSPIANLLLPFAAFELYYSYVWFIPNLSATTNATEAVIKGKLPLFFCLVVPFDYVAMPVNTLFAFALNLYFVEDMEDRAVDMEEDMEDTTSSSHTSSQHSRLQEHTVSSTVADMAPPLLHPLLLPLLLAPTLLSSRLLMPSTTATNTVALLPLELTPLLLHLQLPPLLLVPIRHHMAPMITLATVNMAPLPPPHQQPLPHRLLLLP